MGQATAQREYPLLGRYVQGGNPGRLSAAYRRRTPAQCFGLPAASPVRDALKAIEQEPRTLIFYESTHRLLDSLDDICTVLGESRYVVLARELTKTWESIHGAPVGELLAWVKEDENRQRTQRLSG